MKNLNRKTSASRILKRAVDFHGHLGPYLVLGLKMGDLAVERLKCQRHFGVKAVVYGALNRPKSCLIDGIQLSSGCTYGKGNIEKKPGSQIRAVFYNLRNRKKIIIRLKKDLVDRLESLDGHKDSEALAGELFRSSPAESFEFMS